MPTLTQITPFVMVTNMDKSLAFFTDTLGFVLGFQADNYAFIRRDKVALRLLEAESGADMSDKRRQQSCYIDVGDIDGLYSSLKSKLDELPSGRVRPPFNQDYGQREFHVMDEDALLIFFGEPIEKAQS